MELTDLSGQKDVPDKDKENDTATIYTAIVVAIVVIMVGAIIGMVYSVYRSRIKKKRQKQTAQQSAQVEPVSGASEVGHTTFQQDQSAKKKSQKSNIENEGDVSTILQESDESDEADSLSKEGNNFFRLYVLCQKIATQAVQFYFDSKVPGHRLTSFLCKHKFNLSTDGSTYRCTKDQLAKLFPRGHVVAVSTDFDFTLLYKLIRNLLVIGPPAGGWGNRPLPGHLNKADDIERIRYFRNNLAHNSEFEICDTDFFTHWTDLSQISYSPHSGTNTNIK